MRLSLLALAAGGIFALACANPFGDDAPAAPGAAADVATPADDPLTAADRPPPGGWIADGVIYDKDGAVYGCVGGGNACAGPPAGATDVVEQELDLCGNVDAIRDAELEWRDRNGAYVAAKPTPRDPDALTEAAVAWPTTSPFATLGWSPGGPTRATYWVDVTGEGFEAHGLALVRAEVWLHCYANADQGAVDTPWRAR